MKTRIAETDRYTGPGVPVRLDTPGMEQTQGLIRGLIGSGTDPDEIALRVIEGIEQRALYIISNPGNLFEGVRARFDAITAAGPKR